MGWSFTHIALHNLIQPTPRTLQHGLQILTHYLRLLCDAAFDEVAGEVGRDLARAEDLAVGFDGVGLLGRVAG